MDGSLGPRGYRSDRNICAAPTSVTTVRGGPGCHTTATTCAPPRALRLRLRELGKARVRLEIAPPPGDVATPFERGTAGRLGELLQIVGSEEQAGQYLACDRQVRILLVRLARR